MGERVITVGRRDVIRTAIFAFVWLATLVLLVALDMSLHEPVVTGVTIAGPPDAQVVTTSTARGSYSGLRIVLLVVVAGMVAGEVDDRVSGAPIRHLGPLERLGRAVALGVPGIGAFVVVGMLMACVGRTGGTSSALGWFLTAAVLTALVRRYSAASFDAGAEGG